MVVTIDLILFVVRSERKAKFGNIWFPVVRVWIRKIQKMLLVDVM